jgi:hypothetical protein
MSLRRRELVERRAGNGCEYCRAPMSICAYTFHVEHCVPRSRGGADAGHNLALSCAQCNLKKGGQIEAPDPVTGRRTALFNPRLERWAEHFRLRGSRIAGLTPAGRATVALLDLNSPRRMAARAAWRVTGLWP